MRLGPYELLDEIGRGGLGAVYRARTADGRIVALKRLIRVDGERLTRFERERRLLASLGEAQGFVPLFDAGSGPEGPWLVMPLVGGGTLRDRLRRGPLSVAETLELGVALATALGRAHEQGIVHRDLKPENVLFTDDGRPLIADLGLAKHFDRNQPGASQSVSLSTSGALIGTAGYAAPEQLTDGTRVGPPADVFALGAILYEALTGQPAFVGESVIELLTKVAHGTIEPLARLRPDAPAWLVATIERAFIHEPEERFADGHALARALRARTVSRPSRRRGAVIGAALALVGLGALLVGWREARRSAEARRALERSAEAQRLADTAHARVKRCEWDAAIALTTSAIALSPDLALAWALRGLARGWNRDWEGERADSERALALDPRLVLAWVNLAAVSLSHDDDVPAAHAHVQRALALDPASARAHLALADLLADTGTPGALARCDAALALDPTLAEAWTSRGILRGANGDHAGQIADCTRAIAIAPAHAEAWKARAAAHAALEEWEPAIADYTRALTLTPSAAHTWANLSQAHSRNGDDARAIADATRAIELDPKLASGWLARAMARSASDANGALEDLDNALAVEPKNLGVLRVRVSLHDRTSNLTGLVADYKAIVALAPRDVETWNKLSSIEFVLGDHAGCVAACSKAIEIEDTYQARFQRFLARDRLGDEAGAVADAERALELAPKDQPPPPMLTDYVRDHKR